MRSQSGPLILGLFGVTLLAAGFVTLRFAGYPVAPQMSTMSATEPAAVNAPPRPPRVAAPRAVLALDVSGSMGVVSRPSDPDRLLTVAAVQFFDAYRLLAEEFLGAGESAGLAVVLYGTVAQTIDWGDAGGVFLPVTGETRSLFVGTLGRCLGRPRDWGGGPADDPRRSQDSDYAAALDAVAELMAGLPSPPAVIFLTDGPMDPHPCFTPLLTERQRDRIRVCSRCEPVLPHLAARSDETVFDRRAGDRPINKTDMPADVDVDAGVKRRVARLMGERFPAAVGEAPVAWFPVYLDSRTRYSDVRPVRALLEGTEANRGFWQTGDAIIHCRTAGAMVREFVNALARWYRLTDLPVAPGDRRFRVPADAQAVIVQVASETPLTAVRLVQGDRAVDMSGGGRYWAGYLAGECAGGWQLVGGGGAALDVSIHVALRYGWALAVPDTCVASADGDLPRADLYLCRLTDGGAVTGREIYADLPARLPGAVTSERGEALALDFVLAEGANGPTGPVPTYTAAVPVTQLNEGPAFVSVGLDTLAALGIPVSDAEPSRRVVIKALTRLLIEDGSGRRLDGVRLENVPRAPGWAAGIAKEAP